MPVSTVPYHSIIGNHPMTHMTGDELPYSNTFRKKQSLATKEPNHSVHEEAAIRDCHHFEATPSANSGSMINI